LLQFEGFKAINCATVLRENVISVTLVPKMLQNWCLMLTYPWTNVDVKGNQRVIREKRGAAGIYICPSLIQRETTLAGVTAEDSLCKEVVDLGQV